MEIIKRTGSAIAQNKEETKKILDSYNIPYGAGKTSDLIKSSFGAIKEGNKDLAADIAALLQLKGKSPADKKQILAGLKDKIAKAKNSIQTFIAKLKVQKVQGNSGNEVISASEISNSYAQSSTMNADGSDIETDAMALVSAVETTDAETLSKMAMPDQAIMAGAIIMSVVVLVLMYLAINGVPKFSKIKI